MWIEVENHGLLTALMSSIYSYQYPFSRISMVKLTVKLISML